jgi:hypothetical protein
MELQRDALREAAAKGLVTELQAEHLWQFLSERHTDTPGFHFTHILYYLGGLIAIGAMSLFMNLGWERFGGWGLVTIALVYAVSGLWFTEYFLSSKQLQIPAGIMAWRADRLLREPDRMKVMRENALLLSRPDAAKDVLKAVLGDGINE